MSKPFLDPDGKPVGLITGPWWWNDFAVDPEKEQPPQEAFFQIEFSRANDLKLHLAASDFYQFWLNGRWMGCGPARASHGRLTVDAWELSQEVLRGKNTL